MFLICGRVKDDKSYFIDTESGRDGSLQNSRNA